ncbi:MAG: potassium transporter TrkA [Anaerolineae bacterium]|nr:MAG: potassium transporter TrkA [Anaerolineae bacterium]
MSHKPSFSEKIRYWFDNYMSSGTLALIGGLGVISLAVILLAATIISLGGTFLAPEGSAGMDFIEAAWESLMRTLDPGTMGGDVGWGFRWVMLFVTLGGIFIISTLIGVLTTGLESKIEELRKGRSRVLETNHIVILGWSHQVFPIISELVIANQNQKRSVIAILADKDKLEMEEEIRTHVGESGRTRIICRSGSPSDPADLEIVNPHAARTIIILPPETGDADAAVIKAALALTNSPNRHPEPYNIVTQLRNAHSLAILRMIGKNDRLSAILTPEVIARVTAQTARQSGLSVVYTELLNFGGDEIYFKEEPTLSGKMYGDALLSYEDSALLGIRRADGTVLLNPPSETRFAPGDQLIIISADDDTIRLSGLSNPPVQTSLIRSAFKRAVSPPEKALILGWNAAGPVILRELDNYVAPHSSVTVVAAPQFQAQVQSCCALQNQTLTFRSGDTTDRDLLDALQIHNYNHVIALADTNLDVQSADARTLITLLHLRNIAGLDETPFSIVSEMLDLRNRELAAVTNVDDFIVSDHLISLMTAQLAENAELFGVLSDLFDPQGCEIYLKPVADYVELGQAVNFYTVVEAARRRHETAIGYRLNAQARNPAQQFGVYINPKKSTEIRFVEGDKIIVLAED